MWRGARWVLSGLLILVAVGISWGAWARHKENARFAEYDRQVESLRKIYPVGMRRDAIEKKFKSQLGSESDPDIYALLGSDPSAEWYCSGWNTYAHFKFNDSEQLISIERYTWGK